MDSEAKERVINRITSVGLAAMLMIFAFVVKESLPWVTGIIGTVIGSVTGQQIAERTKKQTLRKFEEESRRPPPPNDDDAPGTETTVMSEPPAPQFPRRDARGRRLYAVGLVTAVAGLIGFACVGSPNPAAGVYGVERLRCVHDHDAAAEARTCMREVDRRYGQDGGLAP